MELKSCSSFEKLKKELFLFATLPWPLTTFLKVLFIVLHYYLLYNHESCFRDLRVSLPTFAFVLQTLSVSDPLIHPLPARRWRLRLPPFTFPSYLYADPYHAK